METEDKKYNKVLKILKKSKPVFRDNEAITEKVMAQLQEEKARVSLPELIIEYLFGWVYIGWIRRSMVAAAMVIVVFFGYQQALILRRINDLSGQKIRNGTLIMTGMTDNLTSKMSFYRITDKKLYDEKINVSEKEIDELIKTLNKLQVKYKDLFYLLENDPELKKYVEDKINASGKN
jgi:hypothetical protein